MHGRKPTKEEKEWLDLLVQIPCVVCSESLNVSTPAEIHHLDGQTKPNAHMLSIPLCTKHHRHADPQKRWVSRHGDGKAAFEREYGSEVGLYTKTLLLVDELKSRCL